MRASDRRLQTGLFQLRQTHVTKKAAQGRKPLSGASCRLPDQVRFRRIRYFGADLTSRARSQIGGDDAGAQRGAALRRDESGHPIPGRRPGPTKCGRGGLVDSRCCSRPATMQ